MAVQLLVEPLELIRSDAVSSKPEVRNSSARISLASGEDIGLFRIRSDHKLLLNFTANQWFANVGEGATAQGTQIFIA